MEEFIRWVTPVLNMRRTVTVDHELHGQQLHEGDEILLLYASGATATRSAFDDPDVLNVARREQAARRVRVRDALLPRRATWRGSRSG